MGSGESAESSMADDGSSNKVIEDFKHEIETANNFEKEFQKFGKIINSIFSKSFGLKYKFTYEDLKFETMEKNLPRNVTEKIEYLCDSMNEMEFDKTKITKEKLLETSSALSSLLSMLSEVELTPFTLEKPAEHNEPTINNQLDELNNAIPKKQGFFSRLFSRKKPEITEPDISLFEPKPALVEPKPIEDQLPSPPKIEEEPKITSPDKLPSFSVGSGKVEMPGLISKGSIREPMKIKTARPEKIKVPKPVRLEKIKAAVKPKAAVPVKIKSVPEVKKVPVQQRIMPGAREIEKRDTTLEAIDQKIKDIERTLPPLAAKSDKPKVREPSRIRATGNLELPKFVVPVAVRQKEQSMRQDLAQVVSGIERSRREISQEIRLIDDEKEVLEREKQSLKDRGLDKKELPEFRILKKNLTNEIEDLKHKKQELVVKEKELAAKLENVGVMEKHLKEWSEKLVKDEKDLRQKMAFLDSKEKVLSSIKKELTNKYGIAMKEIDKIKKDLQEKGTNFMKLQKFYQLRENKLSVDEENLLNEKRQHKKIVSGLLTKHMGLAHKDLLGLDQKFNKLKLQEEALDKKLEDYEKKLNGLVKEKDNIEDEVKKKKLYFDNLEEEFRQKDPEFAKILKSLQERQNNNLSKEAYLVKYEQDINMLDAQLKSKRQTIDLAELDLKTTEKEIERLSFTINNHQMRQNINERQLDKRISSYVMLKEDISRNIVKEKRSIKRIEEKLVRKGALVTKKFNNLESYEQLRDEHNRSVMEHAGTLGEDEELHLREITVSHEGFDSQLSNPAILDILRLLNIAKDFLKHSQTDRARDVYLEIQKRFEELEEEEREEIYSEIIRVFKPKSGFSRVTTKIMPESVNLGISKNLDNYNIDVLIQEFQNSIQRGDIQMSGEIYTKLQEKYTGLPKEDKGRYYPRIMELYNKVLEYQNAGMQI